MEIGLYLQFNIVKVLRTSIIKKKVICSNKLLKSYMLIYISFYFLFIVQRAAGDIPKDSSLFLQSEDILSRPQKQTATSTLLCEFHVLYTYTVISFLSLPPPPDLSCTSLNSNIKLFSYDLPCSFLTYGGRKVCVDPSQSWVTDSIQRLM